MNQVLAAFQSIGPEGFGNVVSQQAPYFSTIQPQVLDLKRNYAEATIPFRTEITNHVGTVHAIAMCNAAELVAGLMTDVSIPDGARWIPQAMSVRYLAKARTSLRAVASGEAIDWSCAGVKVVPVEVFDENEQKVFTAEISMNVKLS